MCVIERFEPTPGRVSIVGRIEGSDPGAPSLCLMGHTDVVPVNPAGWINDPFGGEIIDSPDGVTEVWGRGAVDMLNLTASMAVAFRASPAPTSGRRATCCSSVWPTRRPAAHTGHGGWPTTTPMRSAPTTC